MKHRSVMGFQLIWWGKWIGFGVFPPFPSYGEFKAYVYKWRLKLGIIEIRRWG